MAKKASQPKANTETAPEVNQEPASQQQPGGEKEQVEVKSEPAATDQPKTDMVMSRGTVTTHIISSSATPPQEDKRMVKVLIKYPEEYKRKKYFKDGQVVSASPETAAEFVKRGIATMTE